MGIIFLAVWLLVAAASHAGPDKRDTGAGPVDFASFVTKRVGGAEKFAAICPVETDVVARRVFKDYGAMFIASKDVEYPKKCVFADDKEVADFQASVSISREKVGGREIELQTAAMKALLKASAAAAKKRLTITPRGASAARRSYSDTHRIWISRFDPALKHWVGRGRIKKEDAEKAAKLETNLQVAQVIEWEKDSIWFSTGFDRSIFSSVAAPGTSQHLSMIALDVAEFGNKDVRMLLNQHGWFQTIIDDTPHFTYLGLDEDELPKRGLIAVAKDGFTFWIPNFER
ncbi:MAG TPA: hypothetical protein PKD26_16305 [Pyrinomonadaceae bacterium]|nr:hypothetical protein [Pyrinomonadaceae bacterium]